MLPKVLIIDGEAQMRKGLFDLFSKYGYFPIAVSQGVDAARVMHREVPDLILIDQGVPVGGLKTAGIIRLNPHYGRIPILLGVKAGPREQMRQTLKQGLKVGISGVLVRPYDPGRLLQKVRDCLSSSGGALSKEDLLRKAGGDLGSKGRPDATTAMEVRTQVRELTDLPTLSPAQQRIISIMSQDDEEIDVDALVEAIQSDQALTMRVMRIARSAYYGFTGNFIQTAVTFLGMSKVRQIVQSATVLEVFERQGQTDGEGLDRKGAWAHSVACGLVMQRIARDNKQARHFTTGLLHDVGKLVLDFKFHEYSRAIVEIAEKQQRPMHLVEQELIGISHAEIGQELAKTWQLPNEVGESIAHHHAPFRAYRHKYLSSLIYLADVAVRQMNIGNSGNYAKPEVEDPYAQKLHISLEEVVSQRDDLVRQVEAIVSTES